MAKRKKDVIYPKLRKAGMDETWYVEFSVRDKLTGKMKRRRISDGFKDIDTYAGRVAHGENLIRIYTQKIESGDIGDSELIEYRDVLLYDSQQTYGNVRKGRMDSARVLMCAFAENKATEVTNKTMQTYYSKLRMFSQYLNKMNLEQSHISEVNNMIIVSFLKDAAEKNALSRKTVEKYQQILYTFFKWVIDFRGINIANPVMHIPRIGAVVDESAPGLSAEIRDRLKKAIEKNDPQLWLACCFQYYAGIRPGTELRLLRIKQINFHLKTITVQNYLAKNSRTEAVDIPEQLLDLMYKMNIDNYDGDLYLFGENGLPGPKPLGKNAMRVRFNKFRDQLKLSKEIKFYSWKHSGALELKNKGANMYNIQRHLRHQSIKTTEGYWRKRLGGAGDIVRNEFPDI